MTISLNPLFAGSARQSVPSAEENVAVDAANPFADLLAAQLQVSSLLPTAQAALPREDVATELSQGADSAKRVDLLDLLPSSAKAQQVTSALVSTVELMPDQQDVNLAANAIASDLIASNSVLTNTLVNMNQGPVANDMPAEIRQQRLSEAVAYTGGVALTAIALPGKERLSAKQDKGLDKVIDTKSLGSVKELISLVASGQHEGRVSERGDAKLLPIASRQTVSADVALAGGLKDKGFAVRIEADMALSAAGKDGVVPVALQTAPLTLPGGQGVPTSGDVVIAEPMAKTDAWGEAFGKQLMSNAVAGLEKTTIQVNPEHLGPLEISITMNKEQAQVMVLAANPQARDIVEHHLPALSRMMEQAGLQLADAQVSSQQQGQNQGQEQGRRTAQQHQELVPELNAQVEDLAEEPVSGLRIRA